MALVIIIILHKLSKLFVYIHFQFGNSALSIAHLNHLPEVEKLLVKHGANEVSLYLYDNICHIYIFTKINKDQVQPINQIWFYIILQ